MTVTGLASLVGKLYETFVDGDSITMIICNLRIAFHVPPPNILPGILDLYEERVVALRTLSSYLNGRTQVVSMRGAISCTERVPRGVPQGSVSFYLSSSSLQLTTSMYFFMGILCCLRTERFYLEERGLAEVMVMEIVLAVGSTLIGWL